MVRSPSEPQVRVRFAPSPTGAMHLGSALVALANASIARSTGGTFVLRIDDTDAVRSRDGDVADLLRLVAWFGIEWDEGPIRQSERAAAYRGALDTLLKAGDAYPCFCGDAQLAELRAAQERAGEPPRYDGRCRVLGPDEVAASVEAGAPHVLRFAVDASRDVAIEDLVRGRVVVPAGSFGDPVLCRADGSAGYLLASVVDDVELAITHVVRGEDHFTNTARQLPLFAALGATSPPKFAHLPLLRDDSGRKLSKRDAMGTLDAFVDEGFLPSTVRRYLAELLGQGAIDLLPSSGHVPEFRFDHVSTGAPRVDRARLESLGRADMAQLDVRELVAGSSVVVDAALEPVLRELAAASPSRVALLGELRLVLDGPGAGDLPHVLAVVAPDDTSLEAMGAALELAVALLRDEVGNEATTRVSRDIAWASVFVARLREEATRSGLGGARAVLRPLRVALTGTTNGPALDLVLAAVGEREALRRVHFARFAIDEMRGGNEGERG